MAQKSNPFQRHKFRKIIVPIFFLLMMLLLSACGGDPQTQQNASKAHDQLDTLLAHARSIGVPDTMLQPIVKQEATLAATSAPLTLLGDQPANEYYGNLNTRYQQLAVQVKGLEYQATQQLDYQASQNLQSYASVLSERQAEGYSATKPFADQLNQLQTKLSQAQLPRDYVQISTNAQDNTEALRLMSPAYNLLTSFQQTIKQLKSSHLDTTALNQLATNDQQSFQSARTPDDFSQLIDTIDTQLQQSNVLSTQAIPYVGAAKLQQFSVDIDQIKQSGQDVTAYQQHLTKDQQALAQAHSIGDYLKVSAQIDNDIASIQFPLYRGKASFLVNQFHQEQLKWGKAHTYHGYILDYEYDRQGIGSDADYALQTAQSLDDYKGVIDLVQRDMTHLQAMEADFNDKTPYNQAHDTDKQLMQRYGATSGQVIVVSLIEQTLRLYNNGKLVNSFLITSGQYDKPSPPGIYHIFSRQSPTKFKSSEPKGSAFWYPDTKITYAMAYRSDGYFIHDSWWRANYGPGTNFPHYDTGGDESFAGNGSHGCINMQEQQAGWLYANTSYNIPMIIY